MVDVVPHRQTDLVNPCRRGAPGVTLAGLLPTRSIPGGTCASTRWSTTRATRSTSTLSDRESTGALSSCYDRSNGYVQFDGPLDARAYRTCEESRPPHIQAYNSNVGLSVAQKARVRVMLQVLHLSSVHVSHTHRPRVTLARVTLCCRSSTRRRMRRWASASAAGSRDQNRPGWLGVRSRRP